MADIVPDEAILRVALDEPTRQITVPSIGQTIAMQRTTNGGIWLGAQSNSFRGLMFRYDDERRVWERRFEANTRIPTSFIHTDLGMFIGLSSDLSVGYQWTWVLQDESGMSFEPDTVCNLEPSDLATAFFTWRIDDRRLLTLNQEQSVFSDKFNSTLIVISPPEEESPCQPGTIRL